MSFSTTFNSNSTNITITGNANCFRDPSLFYYSGTDQAYCEELVWSHEYLNIISSIIISILGFYQLTWENHNFTVLRFIAALFIVCGIASLLNHIHNTRTYLLLENFTIYLIEYIMFSIIIDKYCRNCYIVLWKGGIYKGNITEHTSQILTGLNWSFSTFCIYFLLYRDISGCAWNDSIWIYRIGLILPIFLMLLCVASMYYFDSIHRIKIGTITHNFAMAGKAFNYFKSGTSMTFIGIFIWLLIQATCVKNSGLEYIPNHAIFHVFFVYGMSLNAQYYIYLCNDLNNNKMILTQRVEIKLKILDILFPYFMKYKGIYKEEQQRMLNDIDNGNNKQVDNMNNKLSISDPTKIKDLRQSIETLNRERKTRRKQEKMIKKQNEMILKQNKRQRYDQFDVDDYMNDTTNIGYQINTNTNYKKQVELQQVNKNNIQEEEEENDP